MDDIIYELDTQVGPLEKQAKVAREYKQLEGERQNLHLSILVADVRKDKQQLSQLQTSLEELQEGLAEYHHHRELLEAQNQKLKEKRQALNRETESKQAELLELTRALADLEKQIDLIKLETSQKNEKKAEASSQIAELETEISTLRIAEKQKVELLEQLAVSSRENAKALEELQENLQRFSGDPDQLIEKLREDYLALMQKEASLSNQLTLLTSEIEKDNQEQEHQLKAFSEQEKHVVMLEKEHQELLVAYNECSQRLQELLQDYQTKRNQLQVQKASYQDQQGKLFDLLDQKKLKKLD